MLVQSLLVLAVVALPAIVIGVLDARDARRRQAESAALWRLRPTRG